MTVNDISRSGLETPGEKMSANMMAAISLASSLFGITFNGSNCPLEMSESMEYTVPPACNTVSEKSESSFGSMKMHGVAPCPES